MVFLVILESMLPLVIPVFLEQMVLMESLVTLGIRVSLVPQVILALPAIRVSLV